MAEPQAPATEKKARQEVYTKQDFVDSAQAALKEHCGIELSKTKAWDAYKVLISVGFELAKEKPVSLSGVGRIEFITSQRSGNKKMRFRPSTRVDNILNEGGSFLETPVPAATTPPVEENSDDAVVVEATEETPKAPAEAATETAVEGDIDDLL